MNLNDQYILVIEPPATLQTALYTADVEGFRVKWWPSRLSADFQGARLIPYNKETLELVGDHVTDVFITDGHNHCYWYDYSTNKFSYHGTFTQLRERDPWNYEGTRLQSGGIHFGLKIDR